MHFSCLLIALKAELFTSFKILITSKPRNDHIAIIPHTYHMIMWNDSHLHGIGLQQSALHEYARDNNYVKRFQRHHIRECNGFKVDMSGVCLLPHIHAMNEQGLGAWHRMRPLHIFGSVLLAILGSVGFEIGYVQRICLFIQIIQISADLADFDVLLCLGRKPKPPSQAQ